MPYIIIPLEKGHVKVINKNTGEVKARDTTLTKAKKQIKLLEMLEHKKTK